jgi:predicted nuclease of predicted toxin-antitoxin system
MRGKVDENMPIESAAVLRAAGWECDTIFDEALGGAEDADVSTRCQAEGRVLFTLDTDFADIRAYPPNAYVGIVVFRPVKPSRDSVLALLKQLIPATLCAPLSASRRRCGGPMLGLVRALLTAPW